MSKKVNLESGQNTLVHQDPVQLRKKTLQIKEVYTQEFEPACVKRGTASGPASKATASGSGSAQQTSAAGQIKEKELDGGKAKGKEPKGSKSKDSTTRVPSPPPLFLEDDLADLNGDGEGDASDDLVDLNENEQIKKGHDNDDEDGNDNDDEDYNINEDNDDDDNDDNGPGRSSVAGSQSPAAKPAIPAIPMHLTGQQLQTFNELSSILELNEDYKVKGRELCNVHKKSDHFTAMMVNLLASQQKLDDYHEVVTSKITQLLESLSSVSGPMKGWNPAHELRQTVRMIATQCIITGDVQAYTATRDKQGNQEHLPLSLSAKVLDKILENPSEWRKRFLPAQYGRNPDPVESKDFHKWLNVILKEIRKYLNKILLTNIHIPNRAKKTPSLLNVPTIESIIMKTHSSNINRSMKENTTLSEAKARYAWLRMQVIHWGYNLEHYHNHSFWGVVDDKLEDLRTKSVRYCYAYFLVVLRFDFDRFDGNRTFTEIKGTTDFALPSEDEVQAQIKHLDQTHGAVIEQPEASHQEPE
ncbi:uncharacterized protein MELLADRAFT_94697 [Melampsora larici-populina 98AG31]|uniref:Uncharacterized protein n=1 Tax=Melampsora larici-populina (strain 98AG31 / pathotype 3-4-7) TaxID=747676 RepID=F4S7M5_MELLP|nr:uncharacterized protein MELLADRAFT_94697 [Melampsora larici-populina 98AG31]EGF99368.1 hypothetical protein MELLADRAFT_94697 [Melampsora larici-populina 98AG31]